MKNKIKKQALIVIQNFPNFARNIRASVKYNFISLFKEEVQMNNNIDRITRGVAENCREIISVANEDPSARGELLKGGGSNGGALTKVLMTRPLNKIRISENALATCLENDVKPFDYFILTPSQLSKYLLSYLLR